MVHSKKKIVIIHWVSSCSKSVVSFFCCTQKMIFWRMLVTKQTCKVLFPNCLVTNYFQTILFYLMSSFTHLHLIPSLNDFLSTIFSVRRHWPSCLYIKSTSVGSMLLLYGQKLLLFFSKQIFFCSTFWCRVSKWWQIHFCSNCPFKTCFQKTISWI